MTLQTYLEFQFLSTPGIFFANLVVLVVGGLVTDTRERARLLSTLRREGVIAEDDAADPSDYDLQVANWLQRCVDQVSMQLPESSDADSVRKGEAVEITVADHPLDNADDDNEDALDDEATGAEQANEEVPRAEVFSFARWQQPGFPSVNLRKWRLACVAAFLKFAKSHAIDLPPAPTSNTGRLLGHQPRALVQACFVHRLGPSNRRGR